MCSALICAHRSRTSAKLRGLACGRTNGSWRRVPCRCAANVDWRRASARTQVRSHKQQHHCAYLIVIYKCKVRATVRQQAEQLNVASGCCPEDDLPLKLARQHSTAVLEQIHQNAVLRSNGVFQGRFLPPTQRICSWYSVSARPCMAASGKSGRSSRRSRIRSSFHHKAAGD